MPRAPPSLLLFPVCHLLQQQQTPSWCCPFLYSSPQSSATLPHCPSDSNKRQPGLVPSNQSWFELFSGNKQSAAKYIWGEFYWKSKPPPLTNNAIKCTVVLFCFYTSTSQTVFLNLIRKLNYWCLLKGWNATTPLLLALWEDTREMAVRSIRWLNDSIREAYTNQIYAKKKR